MVLSTREKVVERRLSLDEYMKVLRGEEANRVECKKYYGPCFELSWLGVCTISPMHLNCSPRPKLQYFELIDKIIWAFAHITI